MDPLGPSIRARVGGGLPELGGGPSLEDPASGAVPSVFPELLMGGVAELEVDEVGCAGAEVGAGAPPRGHSG